MVVRRISLTPQPAFRALIRILMDVDERRRMRPKMRPRARSRLGSRDASGRDEGMGHKRFRPLGARVMLVWYRG